MDADQDIRFSPYISMYKRKVPFAVDFAAVLDRLELPELCPDTPLRFSPDKLFRLGAMPDQLRHRDHLEPVLPAEFGEFRNASHGAIRVHDFADHASRVQSSEARKVHSCFSLPGSYEH